MKKAERIQSADLLDRQAFFEYRHKKKKMSDLDMNEPAVVFSEKGMEMLASIIRDIVREEVRAVVRQEIQKLNSDPKDEDYDEEYEEFLVEKNRPKGCSLKIFQRALLVEDILRKHGELQKMPSESPRFESRDERRRCSVIPSWDCLEQQFFILPC